MTTTLANLLRRLVTDSGVSLSELARQTGVSQPTLYEFVNGRGGEPRDLSMQNTQRLIDYFGVKIVIPKHKPKGMIHPRPTAGEK